MSEIISSVLENGFVTGGLSNCERRTPWNLYHPSHSRHRRTTNDILWVSETEYIFKEKQKRFAILRYTTQFSPYKEKT